MSYKVNGFITTDKEFPSYEKRLSICLTPNGFSFSVTTLKDALLTVGEVDFSVHQPLVTLTAELKSMFAQFNIPTFGYNRAVLVVPSDSFAWLPENLYEAGKEQQYLSVVNRPTVGVGYYANHNESQQAYMIFTADTTVVTAFRIAFPGIEVRCQHSQLASDTLLHKSSDHPLVVMHLRPGKADCAAYGGGKLLHSNTYPVGKTDDILVKALSVMKEFSLEQPEMELALCGEVDRGIYAALRPYFPHVTLFTGAQYRIFNPEFQHLHTYRHALILV